MKRLLTILFVFIFIKSFGADGIDTIPRSPRAGPSLYASDYRIWPYYNLGFPQYSDTTAANDPTLRGNDYVGFVIFTTSDNKTWVRKQSGGKYWAEIGGGGGSGVTSVGSGLGLSGGPITSTGTLLIDTASLFSLYNSKYPQGVPKQVGFFDATTHKLTSATGNAATYDRFQYDNADNNGVFRVENGNLLETMIYGKGFDYGLVRMNIENGFDSTIFPHGYGSAGVGYTMSNLINSNVGQLVLTTPRNTSLCDNCLMLRAATNTNGLKLVADNSFTSINSSVSTETARFTPSNHFLLHTTTDVGGKYFVNAGSSLFQDSVFLFSRIGSGTDSIYTKRSDGSLGAISQAAFTVPLNNITAATASGGMDNGNFEQDWQWNTLTGIGLNLISASGAPSASSTTQKLLNISTGGTNTNSTVTTYGLYDINNHTGAASTNVAGFFDAHGGTTNIALYVNQGTVNLQPLTATTILGLDGNKNIKSVALSGLSYDGTTLSTINNGTVTSVATGFGLSGGTITTTGTLIADSTKLLDKLVGTNITGAMQFLATQTFNPGTTTGTTTTSGVVGLFNTLTSGTGIYGTSSSLTSGNIIQVTSTSTTLAAGNELLDISSTGVNGTNAITVTGARISVTNTNGTSGTNIGLDVTATGATTKNVALNVTGTTGSSTAFAAQFTGRVAMGGVTAPVADLDVGNGSISTGSITVTTAAGTNQTGNFSTGAQGLVGSNVGAIYQFLSSSTVNAHIFVGGTGATAVGVGLPGAVMILGAGMLSEAASGNHPLLAGAVFLPPTITGAAATVSNTATVYIDAAPSTTVSGQNMALYIRSGELQLGIGTATAGTAPLKFASGTNLTSAEAGATEYDGTELYFTNSAATRGTVEVMKGSTSAAGTLTLAYTQTDYVFTGTTTTWTLPAVIANYNHPFYIKNAGSGNITLNTAAAGNDIYNTSAVNTLTIAPGNAINLRLVASIFYVE